MSEALLTQWKDRVLEAETEVGLIQDDINTVLEERKTLKQSSRKHLEIIEKEKKDLLRRLESVEAEAKELSAVCERTLSEKDKVEVVYIKTLDEYENMHYLVREIKDNEEQLSSREDLETRLQRESLVWAEEEHAMRNKLSKIQLQLKQQRKQQQAEQSELEEQLAALEKRQRLEQAERSSGQTAPAPSVVKTSINAGTDKRFTTDNSFSSVPTHPVPPVARAQPLKSCLKGKEAAVPISAPAITNSKLNTYRHNAYPVIASAPVSRAASQSLVYQPYNIGTDLSSAASHHQQKSLNQARAYSYCSGKDRSRAHDVLQETTNNLE
ncbi:unnamed protein product [Phytomonas sp. Hart1]|nr:unnamed protein product [Phytomonas sp. Hart1]|eukprot:CCW67487.1 unnamed protein product [Phytomonas sp. isolate Hart1]